MRTRSLGSTAAYYAEIAYLFTKSDILTALLPVLLAWASSSTASIPRLVQATLWTWLQVLQFCTSNQSLSPAEDKQNKPWRPIPAGLLSVEQTKTVRWMLLPICLTVSVFFGVGLPGTAIALSTIVYNELKWDTHWASRNLVNATFCGSFDAGASAILNQGLVGHDKSPSTAYINALIVLTTIHASDFRDEIGDRLEKRLTIPIVMPTFGRLSMPVGLILWSLFLGMRWSLSPVLSMTLASAGIFVGLRFYMLKTPEADRKSYVYYHIWLAMARILPVFV